MRAPRSALVRLAMATSLALPTTGFALAGMARATGPTHDGPATVTLKGTGPTGSVEQHDAAAGGWTITVEGNKQVTSVRLAVWAAPAEGCGVVSEDPIYSDKVTDDELATGPVTRSVGLEQGSYCTHFALDGVAKAQSTITTAHPEPALPDPDPTATPTPDPTETPSDYVSKEYERCSVRSEDDAYDELVDHRVLAGAKGPHPDAPFNYTKFYPSTLQVHSGDLVEWCFNGGYDWHTVNFSPDDMDVAAVPVVDENEGEPFWRHDENGSIALQEEYAFGPEMGDEDIQCGRGPYWHLKAQTPCEFRPNEQQSEVQEVGSALWDRFFSINSPTGTFRTFIDLPEGLYRYRCELHVGMTGYIEVLPGDAELANPSHLDIDTEIAADYRKARDLFEELSDPSDAYDFEKRRWNVHAGATTPDGSVEIYQFMPTRLDVRKGDRVHYEVGSFAHTVTFPGGRQFEGSKLPTGQEVPGMNESDLQGGFNARGRCGPHSCSGANGVGAPWGLTGLGFLAACDPDDPASGSATPLPYAFAAAMRRAPGAPHGCIAGGLPEIYASPWIYSQQRAPQDLVTSEKTFHNSGLVFDLALPGWTRSWESNGVRPGGEFPGAFDAWMPPAQGSLKYFCAIHEFMNGVVVVNP